MSNSESTLPATDLLLYPLDGQGLANPDGNTSTREQHQCLKFKKGSEKNTGIKEDLSGMESNKIVSLTEGFIVATALPLRAPYGPLNRLGDIRIRGGKLKL